MERISLFQRPCRLLQTIGEKMRLDLGPEHAAKLDHIARKRFGDFFDSIRKMPSGEKIRIIEAAYYLYNNDLKLAHSLGLELKKAGRTDESEQVLSSLPSARVFIPPGKMGIVIGHKGATIRKLSSIHNVRIDAERQGAVTFYSWDEYDLMSAANHVEWFFRGLRVNHKIGEVLACRVIMRASFGLLVELLPGKTGIIPGTELLQNREKKREIELGDQIKAKIIHISDHEYIYLSEKAAISETGISPLP